MGKVVSYAQCYLLSVGQEAAGCLTLRRAAYEMCTYLIAFDVDLHASTQQLVKICGAEQGRW